MIYRFSFLKSGFICPNFHNFLLFKNSSVKWAKNQPNKNIWSKCQKLIVFILVAPSVRKSFEVKILGSKLLKFNFTHLSEKILVIFTVVRWKKHWFCNTFFQIFPMGGKNIFPWGMGKNIFRIPQDSPWGEIPGEKP